MIFGAIIVAFVGFRIWLISRRSRRSAELPPAWMRRFRSPEVAEVVAVVAAGVFALVITLARR